MQHVLKQKQKAPGTNSSATGWKSVCANFHPSVIKLLLTLIRCADDNTAGTGLGGAWQVQRLLLLQLREGSSIPKIHLEES